MTTTDDRQAELADMFLWYEPRQKWLGGEKGGVRAILSGAELMAVNLSYADLSDADLSGANLRWSNFRGANLNKATLIDANLVMTNLNGASLSETNLSEASFSDAERITGSMYECRLILGKWLQYGCVCLSVEDWTPERQDELCARYDSDAASDLARCVDEAKRMVTL